MLFLLYVHIIFPLCKHYVCLMESCVVFLFFCSFVSPYWNIGLFLFTKEHDSEANKNERKVANMQLKHCTAVYRTIARDLCQPETN